MSHNLPNPVVLALLTKKLKSSKTKKATKALLKAALSAPAWRFQGQPDEVRKIIAEAVMADLKAMIYPSNSTLAHEYGVSPANIVKWKHETTDGNPLICPRGRPTGVKDSHARIRVAKSSKKSK